MSTDQTTPKSTMERLIESNDALTDAVKTLTGRVRIQRNVTRWLGALTAGLIVVLGMVGWNTYRTSNGVLCPLYGLFVDSLDPDADHDGTVSPEEQAASDAQADADRDGTVSDAERADYEDAVDVILDGYRTLGCD